MVAQVVWSTASEFVCARSLKNLTTFDSNLAGGLGSYTSRKTPAKTVGIFLRQFGFGVFRVVFAGVAAGRVRLRAIFVFFSTTFRTIVTVRQLLQKT